MTGGDAGSCVSLAADNAIRAKCSAGHIGGCNMTTTYQGGCHCGRVRFRVTASLDGVTYCNCSMCAKKGFWHLIVPPDSFELLSGKDDLTTYKFNTGVAQHTFCKHCGI